jgi:hypothetical protein
MLKILFAALLLGFTVCAVSLFMDRQQNAVEQCAIKQSVDVCRVILG